MDEFVTRTAPAATPPAGCVNARRYAVPLAHLTPAEREMHQERLTLVPQTMMATGREEPLRVYETDETHLYVPRFYGIKTWGVDAASDGTTLGQPMARAAFAGTLNGKQQEIVAAAMSHLAAPWACGVVLELYCGFGKTVVALWLARQLGRRCAVLVHTTLLLEQWRERVRQFLGIEAGVIQRNKVDHEHDVVVCMLPSLWSHDYDARVLDSFGTLIVDEAHHVPARTYYVGVSKLACRYTIGATATPKRADGLTELLYWTLGGNVCRVERSRNDDVRVECLHFEGAQRVVQGRDGNPIMSIMLNALAADRARNKRLVDKIVECYGAGHNIIVLSDRIAQLHAIREALGDRCEVGVLISATPAAERVVSAGKRLILTTWPMAREGLDIPRLDCLVMATPKGDVEQAVGRILRAQAGKMRPFVVDVFDGFSLFLHLQQKRLRWYKKMGYDIENAR